MIKSCLIILGFIPLGMGFIMNWLMMTFSETVLPYIFISAAFLVFWTWISYICSGLKGTKKASVCLLNLPLFLALAFNLYQEIVLGYYFNSLLGICTQFFYLPILNISYTITSWSGHLWTAYIAGFLLICLASFTGCILKKHRTRSS